jgi:outer membrane protein assembly factor BamB
MQMMQAKVGFLALALAAAAPVHTDPTSPVNGWWRAMLTHAGESRDIWLHFQDRNGKSIVGFGNPTIGVEDTPLSAVTVKSDSVELTSLGWSLHREADGTLTGIVPDALIPLYRMPARFVASSAPPPRPPSPSPLRDAPTPVWRQDLGAPVYGGVAFDPARKRVIVAAESGRVSALRAGDGTVAWSVDAQAPIRATPLVAGASLFLATDTSLLKLDVASGRRRWSADLGQGKPRLPITDPDSRYDDFTSGVVISGNSVYVGSRDGCVRRIGIASGEVRGRYCAKDMVTSTPVVDGARVYFASFDNHVYSADTTSGRILWTYDTHGPVPRDLALVAGKIVAGSRSFDLVALDTDTGHPAWTRYYWYSWVDSVPNVVGRTMYIGSSDSLRVYALDSGTGRKQWETVVPGWTWAKPAIGRRTVYAAVTGTATPYIGPRLGGFAAIDRTSGKLRWLLASDKPDKAPEYGFASAPVVANGMVYAADLKGKVFAFRDE